MNNEKNNGSKIDGTGLTEKEIYELFDLDSDYKRNISIWFYGKKKNGFNVHDVNLYADFRKFLDSTEKLGLPYLKIVDAVKYLMRIGLETFKGRISEVENEK